MFRDPRTYTVMPGDSLYTIAKKFNTTVESIMALNNLTSTSLSVGQRLEIPAYTDVTVNVDNADVRRGAGTGFDVIARMARGARLSAIGFSRGWYRVRLFNGQDGWMPENTVTRKVYGENKPIEEILAFYTLEEGPGLPSSFRSFVDNSELITSTGLFMYRIDRNNPTQIEKFGQFSDRDVEILVAIGHRNNIRMMPVVHNLLYRGGETEVSKNVVRAMLATRETRNTFIQNIIRLIQRFEFDGVNIDIEDVYREDSGRLSAFYTELGAELKRLGYYFSASIPSRISDRPFNPFSDPFDYAVIGRAVDEFVVMLYNEHGWPGSGPGPVVSQGWMDRVLRYTATKMPPEKIMAAVSLFGFDFNLTTGRNRLVTHAQALAIARRYNAQIRFDQPTKTPMFAYTDERGNRHEVWFEDRRSILAKAQLASSLGIKGLALWRIGLEDPEIWTVLSQDMVVRKVI